MPLLAWVESGGARLSGNCRALAMLGNGRSRSTKKTQRIHTPKLISRGVNVRKKSMYFTTNLLPNPSKSWGATDSLIVGSGVCELQAQILEGSPHLPSHCRTYCRYAYYEQEPVKRDFAKG